MFNTSKTASSMRGEMSGTSSFTVPLPMDNSVLLYKTSWTANKIISRNSATGEPSKILKQLYIKKLIINAL